MDGLRQRPDSELKLPVHTSFTTSEERARRVREQMPAEGLLAGHEWRTAVAPYPLSPRTVRHLEFLGRILLQFYRAANLLYRQSVAGKQPGWVADYLDRGKPDSVIELQRANSLKNDLPRVLRPDILLTEQGLVISELDSVPGGIGLTAWLNRTYGALEPAGRPGMASEESGRGDRPTASADGSLPPVVGGTAGMLEGFQRIFGAAQQVHLVVSEESAAYRPEMEWLAHQLNQNEPGRWAVRDANFAAFRRGDAVYRFFEMFDLANVPSAGRLFELAQAGEILLTPPPKPVLEEKLWFALLWNRNLREFWRQALGETFLRRLQAMVPYTWVMDPTPLPHHAALPGLDLTDWHQLKTLSQRERDLIVKVSGYSDRAWGSRGVYLGSDLSVADWSQAVDVAITNFHRSPHILQRYHKPITVQTQWFDSRSGAIQPMAGRVRLCPYYFVTGEGDRARAGLGGVLATICPADKKIIHGMKDAILAPCVEVAERGNR